MSPRTSPIAAVADQQMKIYTVGGAVRDQLLGLKVQDRDFVVVGASPQAMLDAGFKPVGHDFPVFLHPSTHEEYALARTERKVAPGYAGFTFHSSPDVTLEQDLQRRDLTINAIAQAEDGSLIDPYGGQADLRAKVFRHVSNAFSEDPVRILRVARFAARFAEFTVATQTMALMQSMVAAGEVDALVPERVWQELSRGLMQNKPSRMFNVLSESGALARIAPEFQSNTNPRAAMPGPEHTGATMSGQHWLDTLDQAAGLSVSLSVRFAIWAQAIPKTSNAVASAITPNSIDALTTLCQRLRVPSECRTLATLAFNESKAIADAHDAKPEELLSLLSQADAFRRPERFDELLQVVRLIHTTGSPPDHPAELEAAVARLRNSLAAAREVDSAKLAEAINADDSLGGAERGDAIKRAVHQARLRVIETQLASRPASFTSAATPIAGKTHGEVERGEVERGEVKSQRFWKRLIRAPFAILVALVLGFIDWLWNPLLHLIMRLRRFWIIRALEDVISRLPPYGALLVFATPALLLMPFKLFGLYLIGIGEKLAGAAVFILAKIVGTALFARIFSLTSPALMSLPWFSRLYSRFKAFKTALYSLVFDHPWIRLIRRLARRRIDQIRRLLTRWRHG